MARNSQTGLSGAYIELWTIVDNSSMLKIEGLIDLLV